VELVCPAGTPAALRAAIDAGYARALPAILDSNTTTFLSGIILFQFGSDKGDLHESYLPIGYRYLVPTAALI
jgi:hypothetical protein